MLRSAECCEKYENVSSELDIHGKYSTEEWTKTIYLD